MSSPPHPLLPSRPATRRKPWRAPLPSLAAACCVLLVAGAAPAIQLTPFGSGGIGGSINGQNLRIGADGAVYELDAFLVAPGAGPSISLADSGALPSGLGVDFSFSLSADATDLSLTWAFENQGSGPLPGLVFLSFVDAEIAEPTTTFFNEYADVEGAPAAGQDFEIDEPGFAGGDIASHLAAGALDGSNAVPISAPDDVSMALSFEIGELAPGDLARIQILLSEDGDRLGPLALVQRDPRVPGQAITYSGAVLPGGGSSDPIPEPGAALLFGAGSAVVALRLRRATR